MQVCRSVMKMGEDEDYPALITREFRSDLCPSTDNGKEEDRSFVFVNDSTIHKHISVDG